MTDKEPFTSAGHPRCQASAKVNNPRNRTALADKGQCQNRALPGLTVCKRHGGNTPAAKAKTLRHNQELALEKAIIRFGARRDIDPATALLEVVQHAAGDVTWLRDRITDLLNLTDTGDPGDEERVQQLLWAETRKELSGDDIKSVQTLEPHPLWIMLEKANDRLIKASSAAIAAGLAERTVALAESQGAMVAHAIRGVLAAMLEELQRRGLPAEVAAEWPGLVASIVPQHLRALAASETEE